MGKWDDRFMSLAQHIATWSKDDSTQVACVLVDGQNRIVSLGFNGPPRAVNDQYRDREQKLRRTVHAEKNALAFAGRSVQGCRAYITHPPCSQCAAYLIQHQVSSLVFPKGSEEFLSRWGEDFAESLEMLAEAGVEVIYYDGEQEQ